MERWLRNKDVICRLQLKSIRISSSAYLKVESRRGNPSVDMILILVKIFQYGYEEVFVE